MACLVCGGEVSPWLFMPVDPLKNEPTPHSTVKRCDRCGLGALSPVPRADEIASFYEIPDYYTHGNNGPAPRARFAERALFKLASLADRSERFRPKIVALKPDARVCDLGCGHGFYLRKFRELGFDVVGVDPDLAAREEACLHGIMVLDGTAENLPELHGKFDLVILSHTLEHCRDPRTALENARSLLKPDGLCYVEVPNCSSEHFRTFTVCSMMFDAPRHIHFFTPECLAKLAEQVGFTVARTSFAYYDRNFAPDWRAYEASIADKAPKGSRRHTFAASVTLFLRSFWRRRESKYDSFGLWLTQPPTA